MKDAKGVILPHYPAHGQKSCIHVMVLHGFSTNFVLLSFK
jgi:hypothetical protein